MTQTRDSDSFVFHARLVTTRGAIAKSRSVRLPRHLDPSLLLEPDEQTRTDQNGKQKEKQSSIHTSKRPANGIEICISYLLLRLKILERGGQQSKTLQRCAVSVRLQSVREKKLIQGDRGWVSPLKCRACWHC